MIKVSEKMDKSHTYKSLVLVIFHSFLFQESHQVSLDLILIHLTPSPST